MDLASFQNNLTDTSEESIIFSCEFENDYHLQNKTTVRNLLWN